ncbi:MAG: tetratricopeptide repeat protein [Verrucomicrobiota bacterium]|jgi:tetratricopeptide (TPR) repeat protein|nr:tetratricopeptide repeat protein [Verrucomicrobiota bacterium]
MNGNDIVEKPLKYRWWISGGLCVLAFGLYLATMSRGVFPGLPAKNLAWHLKLDAFPTLLDSLWGLLVRWCSGLPGANTPFWTALVSVVCGALCVLLASALMMRVRYSVHDTSDSAEMKCEASARRLAGATTGLFLMVCIPFWILSTRSLPGAFHLLLLLSVTWLFSEYQRTGKTFCLYWLGFLYGVGLTEFATLWVLAPFTALLVVRAMLQRAEFRWPVLIRTGVCCLPGLFLYVVNGWVLWGDPTIKLRGFRSMWSVIWYIWRDQWNLITSVANGTGFLIVMSLAVIPWCILFLLRAKKPAWRYSAWQVGLRLIVLLSAMAVLFNAPLSPWRFFGMRYLMLTPYLILSVCAGYVVGEFWVMGQVREHRNAGIGQSLRSLFGVLALVSVIGCLVAGGLNFRIADGRPGARIQNVLAQSLERLTGQNVILGSGALDDALHVVAHDLGQKPTIITLSQMGTAIYRDYVATFFPEPRQKALLQIGIGAFLQDYLSDDVNLVRTAALDMADPLREYGYLIPAGLLYYVVPTADRVDLPQIISRETGFWNQMEEWGKKLSAVGNPGHIYEEYARRVTAKMVNNIGFSQVEAGLGREAMASFEQARRIDPDNLSALLNLLTLAQSNHLPELAGYEAEWKERQKHLDNQIVWTLASVYGYVHNTGYLVRNGMMWAVSGKPKLAEAELRRASGGRAISPEVKAFLGRAYLHSGDLEKSADFYQEAVNENPEDAQSIVMLAELSLMADDLDAAEALLNRAEELGVEPPKLAFERIVLTYLRGRADEALMALKELVKTERSDIRALAFLAMLTANGRDQQTYDRAVRLLRNQRGASPDVRLLVAELLMNEKDWEAARSELEQVTRMNPRQILAWEMLIKIDFQERKRDLAEDHVRMLLTLAPENYLGNLMLGSFQYARGQYSLAESSYRAALKARREPLVLNDLAYLLLLKGDLAEARELIEEALALEASNPIYLSTRSEINLREGRLEEAQRDLQQVLAVMPDNAQARLLAAEVYLARGQDASALSLAEKLLDRQMELPEEQQSRLHALIKQLR